MSFSKGKRPGARKIAILITDGQSNVDPTKTIPNAELLKASGVEIFVIAVGNYKTGISEIVKIASPDPKDHVFRVTNMNGLLHVTELAFKSVAPKKYAVQAMISGFVKIPSLKTFLFLDCSLKGTAIQYNLF